MLKSGKSRCSANLQHCIAIRYSSSCITCMLIEQELCPNEWRPSRLEAECVQGDGLLFSFPVIECSPLVGRQLGSYTTRVCTFVPASSATTKSYRKFLLSVHVSHNSKKKQILYNNCVCALGRELHGVATVTTFVFSILLDRVY